MDGDRNGPPIMPKFMYSNKKNVLLSNLALMSTAISKSYAQFNFKNLESEGRFPKRKSAKNNDGYKRPLLESQIEESFQTFFFSKKCGFIQKYETK